MTGKRKRYSADFKAKVALDAIRGEQTIAQLSAKHGIHQTMINAWKKQAIEGMSGVFSGRAEAAEAVREGEIDQLHAKIGQLVSTGTEVSPDVGFQNSLPGRFWFRGSAGVVIGLDPPRRAAAAFRRRRRRDEGFRANMLGNEIGMLAQAIA